MDEQKSVEQEISITGVNIKNCSLCHMEHLNLRIVKLPKPIDWYNYIATCPFKNETIRIKFVTD